MFVLRRSLRCNSQLRTYISRAHPKPTPEFALPEAIETILTLATERREKRLERWNEAHGDKKSVVENPNVDSKAVETIVAAAAEQKEDGAAENTVGENTSAVAAAGENKAEKKRPTSLDDLMKELLIGDSKASSSDMASSDTTDGAISDTSDSDTTGDNSAYAGSPSSSIASLSKNKKLSLKAMAYRAAKKERFKNFVKPKPYIDETIELALNLNLDPRKPGQALRGQITLPHGTGKIIPIVVFTDDDKLAKQAKEAGATHAGGQELIDDIVAGRVPLDFDRALGTADIQRALTKAARILGPRGLMPNAKAGTLIEPGNLINELTTQIAGQQIMYRTDKEGIVHVPVGKQSFGKEKLIENIGSVMTTIFAVKPEAYGRKKGNKKTKASKNAKYLLRASICATQGPGMRLINTTVDPNSPFFLTTDLSNLIAETNSSRSS